MPEYLVMVNDIENVVTHKDYRCRGLAQECLNFAREIALKENCYKMMLLELKKKDTFEAGIGTLLTLRDELMDEDAVWLIDYWCGKDVRGLIQMPFSRHWIMHIEACLRIMKKL